VDHPNHGPSQSYGPYDGEAWRLVRNEYVRIGLCEMCVCVCVFVFVCVCVCVCVCMLSGAAGLTSA
jgi:hypothetical protein